MADLDELRVRYERRSHGHSVDEGYLGSLEAALSVSLPKSFVRVASFFSGAGITTLPLHTLSSVSTTNVVDETKRLRARIDLPNQFLVLAEPPASLIVLDTGTGNVLWCDSGDARRLGREPLLTKPTVWESFADFVAYLLDEEDEEERSDREA